MRIMIKKESIIDQFVLLLMYLQLVILEFFGFGQILNKLVCGIILLRVVIMKGRQWQTGVLYGMLLCCLFALSVFMGEKVIASNVKSTFLMLCYPMVYTYYIVFLCRNKPGFFDECISRYFWVFNTTMVVNLIVLLFQIFVPYSIQAIVADSQVISYYEDTISGLFQYASVHVVCLFTIFICIYDISYLKKIRNRNVKHVLMGFVALMILISCVIAVNNDNKAFFLLLPLSLFMYWYAGKMDTGRKAIYLFGAGVVGIILIWIGYSFSDSVKAFLDNTLFHTLKIIREAWGLGVSAKGSNERIAIIGYALSFPCVWLFGTGFGSSGFYTSGYHGFYHFGQADFSSILLLGGVWFSILILLYYYKSFMCIVRPNTIKNKRALRVSVLMILLSTSIYTQCYTRTNIMETLILIMLAFRVRVASEKQNQGGLE